MSTLTAQPNSDPAYLRAQGLSANIVERFYDKIFILTYDSGCWLWIAHLHHGYGWLNTGVFPYRVIPAHVASWIIHNGPLGKGQMVLHKCPGRHRRECCNPTHLKPGGKQENGRDSITQGTNAFFRLSPKFQPKLNPQKAAYIRQAWIGYRGQQTELAKEFGVSRHAIALIIREITWRTEDRKIATPDPQPDYVI